jgi:hypothetical protein
MALTIVAIAAFMTALVRAQVGRTPQRAAASAYFPDRFDWQTRTPPQANFDPAKLEAAIKYAIATENRATKHLALDLATTFGREP